MEKISVGIPHYNRSKLLEECLNNILHDDRIGEIVINDDFSPQSDFDQVEKLKERSDKIKVFRNSSNLGAYRNKLETIKNCTLDWVILLDSDNYLYKSYLDSLYSESPWDPNVSYYADMMLANGNIEPWGRCEGCWDHGRFGNDPIGFNEVKPIHDKDYGFDGLLNAGNFFSYRKFYLERAPLIFEEEDPSLREPYGCDAIAFNYYWMKSGGKIKVMQKAEYYHRMHPGSHWTNTSNLSGVYNSRILQKFKSETI